MVHRTETSSSHARTQTKDRDLRRKFLISLSSELFDDPTAVLISPINLGYPHLKKIYEFELDS